MKIQLRIMQDSFNTYPQDRLEVECGNSREDFAVALTIDGGCFECSRNREIQVDARDLYRALYALYGDDLKNL